MTEADEARLTDAVRRVQRDLDATLGPGTVQIDPNTTEGSALWIGVGGIGPLRATGPPSP